VVLGVIGAVSNNATWAEYWPFSYVANGDRIRERWHPQKIAGHYIGFTELVITWWNVGLQDRQGDCDTLDNKYLFSYWLGLRRELVIAGYGLGSTVFCGIPILSIYVS